MPFRHSDEFSDWLDLTKIQLGRWNPGLFRNATPSDVPSRESRWDQAPATPSASGTPASSSSLSPNLVRLGLKVKERARGKEKAVRGGQPGLVVTTIPIIVETTLVS